MMAYRHIENTALYVIHVLLFQKQGEYQCHGGVLTISGGTFEC